MWSTRQRSRAGCQPLPAFLLQPWHAAARQKRSNARDSIFFTWFTLMSAHPFPCPHLCPWLPVPAAFCPSSQMEHCCTSHCCTHSLLSPPPAHQALSCLQTSFPVVQVLGELQRPCPRCRRCWPQPFCRLSPPLLLSNKSLSSAFFPLLFPLNAASICVPSSFAVCPEAMTASAFSVLPYSSPFHLITTALLPLGFVPLNLSYFLRLI